VAGIERVKALGGGGGHRPLLAPLVILVTLPVLIAFFSRRTAGLLIGQVQVTDFTITTTPLDQSP
jgi:hypothetical protein